MSDKPRILMCPPRYYGIEYEINPWMSRSRPAERAKAEQQWNDLKRHFEEAGAEIVLQEPVEGLPDMVFTANAALIYRKRAIISRFRYSQRQGEEPHAVRCLQSLGFSIETLDEDAWFEGAGDALFCGDTLFGGYRIRSDARVHHQIGVMLSCRTIPLELVDSYYYHLDTCFCPLAPGVAIYYPDAFDEYGQRALKEHVPTLVPVERDEARRFACNAVVIGKTVVTNTGCDALARELTRMGFKVVQTPLDEFVKAGGSAKCLTLRLDGEEAAGWKYRDLSAD